MRDIRTVSARLDASPSASRGCQLLVSVLKRSATRLCVSFVSIRIGWGGWRKEEVQVARQQTRFGLSSVGV